MRRQNLANRTLVALILLALSIVYLVPIYVMIITALKSTEEINQG